MYEGKPLSEVTYEDVVAFLELERAEAEDLDYKQEWHDKHVRTVCAIANTAVEAVAGNHENPHDVFAGGRPTQGGE